MIAQLILGELTAGELVSDVLAAGELAAGELSLTKPMLIATSAAILVTMTLALARAMLGPTVFDRILALNMFGTKTVLLISVVSFLSGRRDFLDLALLYSLMNFIGMVAVLRFTEYKNFGETSS